MARAKRTDRTEARRRHRAEQAALVTDETVDDGEELESAPAGSKGSKATGSKAPAGAPAARPGIMSSFRGAVRPLDLKGDLRAAPKILSHWGVLLAIGVAIVSSIVYVTSTNELGASLDFSLADPYAGKQLGAVSNLSYLAMSLFVAPPPAAGAFLLGFTAKRGSWLGGLAFGIVAAICYMIVLQTPSGRLLTGPNSPEAYILNAAAISPVGAALFASAAAWYRRFLDLANPNRGQRGKGKPQQGRGNMKQKTVR